MAGETRIIATVRNLSHQAADDLCWRIMGQAPAHNIVLDLTRTEDASTAAFARLVLLRKHLLERGRDLRLRGLRQRTAKVWRINRLGRVLPVQ